MLGIVAGQSIRHEEAAGIRAFDLLVSIRSTRMMWLGHILVMDEKRLETGQDNMYHIRRELAYRHFRD